MVLLLEYLTTLISSNARGWRTSVHERDAIKILQTETGNEGVSIITIASIITITTGIIMDEDITIDAITMLGVTATTETTITTESGIIAITTRQTTTIAIITRIDQITIRESIKHESYRTLTFGLYQMTS